MSEESIWFVYMLRCCDNSLYTGITTDLERRLDEHRKGEGARYTRSRKPLDMVYYETTDSRSQASKREFAIKQLSKLQKEALLKCSPADKQE